MPYDPTRSIQGSPDLSPTTLILNQLKAKGVPLNAANVRRAVMENARNSNEAGPDPVAGLRNMEPIASAGDPGVGGGGNVAGKIEGGGRKAPARPQSRGPTAPMDRRDTSSGAPTTSAPPANISDLILPFGMGAGGGAAAYGLNRYLNSRGGGAPDAEFMGNRPMDPTGRSINVDLPGIAAPGGGAQSRLPTPTVNPGAIEGPVPQVGGLPAPEGQPGAPAPTDMETAMQRAIAPPGSSEVDLGGVRPFVNPGDVRGPGLPPGITDVDAARAAIGPGGMDTGRVGGQVGVPDINLPARPRIAPPDMANPGLGDLGAQILRMFGGHK